MTAKADAVLVTGAAGLIGRSVCEHYLHNTDCTVYGLDLRAPSDLPECDRFAFIAQDITEDFEEARFPRTLDCIIHMAAEMDSKDRDRLSAVNVAGTGRLLDYGCRCGIGGFVFGSTGGVYGYSDEPLREAHPVKPLNDYAASKHTAERLVEDFGDFFHVVTLRLFFPYGPGQRGRLISSLVDRIRAGEPVFVHPGDHPRINPVHVNDVALAVVCAAELDRSDTFNIAGGETVTVRRIAEIIGKKLGALPQFTRPSGTKAVGDMAADISRAERLLRWRPRIALSDGLDSVI